MNATHRFEFPFIAAIAVFVGWFFAIDLLSSGGNWTAWVTLFVGIIYFVSGSVSDSPSSFWLHFAAGLLIGGSLLYWWHSGTFGWILIGLVSLIYIGIAHGSKRRAGRCSGRSGSFAMTAHFSDKWSHNHVSLTPSTSSVSAFSGWVPPLVFAILGGVLVALGLGYSRRRGGSASAH
jgi:hypothetical protein